MCKSSCCPGNSSGNGLGIALAAVAGLALVSAVARALIHVVVVIAQAVVITAAAALVVALAAVVAAVVIRARLARHLQAWQPAPIRLRAARAAGPSAPTWARVAFSARICALGPVSLGPGKPVLLHRKLTEEARQHRPIIIVDGKQPGRWP